MTMDRTKTHRGHYVLTCLAKTVRTILPKYNLGCE